MGKKKRSSNNSDINISNIRFYYGIPHCHSSLSTGTELPTEAFDYAKHKSLDYMIITDNNTKLNTLIDDRSESISKWQYLLKCVNKFNKRNEDFIALHGFEAHTSLLGDLNIINTKSYFSGTVTNLNALLFWLFQDENTIVSINHPNESIETLEFNQHLNKYISCIDIGLRSPQNNFGRYEKTLFSLLDNGWRLGTMHSLDSHKINFNEIDNLTGIVCNSFNKESLLSALKNRHTFATESKSLKLYFTLNSVFMGGEVDNSSSLDFYIYAEDYIHKIEKIQIITNGGAIIKEMDSIELNNVKFLFKKSSDINEDWYIVKVFLSENRIALTSPIFIVDNN